ncbi:MAG TPA: DMT family transporter [Bacteroidales bacterium]|nr:DMT family transporter [Bacteroidales bacterium]
MNKRWVKTPAHLALIAANIIYGMNYSIAKEVIPVHIRPFALLSLRSGIAALLFWVTSLFMPKDSISRKDIFYICAVSVFGVVINQAFFLLGLALTSPINSSVILSTNPIFAFLFAALILKEKVTFLKGTGLAIGFAGVMMLILENGSPDPASSTFVGDMFSLVNTVSWALYTVLIKRMLEKYHPVTVMKWAFLPGVIVNIPIGYNQLSTTDWSAIPVNAWLQIGFVVVFATYLGYLLISYGLRRVSPTIVSIYTYLQPVFAALLATMMGQDTIIVVMIFSATLIFAGVYVVSRQRNGDAGKQY